MSVNDSNNRKNKKYIILHYKLLCYLVKCCLHFIKFKNATSLLYRILTSANNYSSEIDDNLKA